MKNELRNVFVVFVLIAVVSFGVTQVYANEQSYLAQVQTQLNYELVISDTRFVQIKKSQEEAEQLQRVNLERAAKVAQQQVQAEAEASRLAAEKKALAAAQTDAERKMVVASAEATRVAAAKTAQAQAMMAEQKAAQAQAEQLAQMQAKQRATELLAAQKSSRQSRAS